MKSKTQEKTYTKWKTEFHYEDKVFFSLTSNTFLVQITGGSVIIKDLRTGNEIKRFKGYNYLYTGDVKPDESELFALENGKHFYIFSLEDYSVRKRVTLPRNYESIDVCGMYSADGAYLYVPIQKYEKEAYGYWLCKYETESYSLLGMERISDIEEFSWPQWWVI